MKILLTGGTGFIGKNLLEALSDHAGCISLRQPSWRQELGYFKPDRIVHLGGKADAQGSENEIWAANLTSTQALLEEAIKHGVKRFIYLSSIQVLGETSDKQGQFHLDSPTHPLTPYARSKLAAEQKIRSVGIKSSMEVVILRPPLVYGPGVKANFRNLLSMVNRGMPLPLSALNSNQRSFVGISNLIDLILICLNEPAAANQTFFVSDDDDISTTELVRRIGKALGKPIRNLPLPRSLIQVGLQLIGKKNLAAKLFGNFRVDISETKKRLGWSPKVNMEEELRRTAGWWKTSAGDCDFS